MSAAAHLFGVGYFLAEIFRQQLLVSSYHITRRAKREHCSFSSLTKSELNITIHFQKLILIYIQHI